MHTGSGRTDEESGSTWILADSLVTSANKWGIRHNQPSNDIEFYGSNTITSKINLGTGIIESTG